MGTSVVDKEAVVDAERGVLLRVVDRFDGRDLEVRQLASLTFDEALPGEVFTFVLPEGEELLTVPESQEVTLEEASAAADFAVYVPAELPGGVAPKVVYWPGWQRSGLRGAEVSLQFSDISIRQYTGFRCVHEAVEWQHVRHDGEDLMIASVPLLGMLIRLRKGDTNIEVTALSAHPQPPEGPSVDQQDWMGPSTDAVIALAAGLVPVTGTVRPPGELDWQAPAGPAAQDLPRPVTAPPPVPVEPGPPAIASELCTLLECIFGPEERFRSLQATVKCRDILPKTWPLRIGHTVTDLFVEAPSEAPSPTVGGFGYGLPATLTDIGPFITWMDVEANGHTTVASHRGIRVRARLGPPPIRFPARESSRTCLMVDKHLHALVWGIPDEWELVIDPAHGVLLRAQARAAGKTVGSIELDDVHFDPRA